MGVWILPNQLGHGFTCSKCPIPDIKSQVQLNVICGRKENNPVCDAFIFQGAAKRLMPPNFKSRNRPCGACSFIAM